MNKRIILNNKDMLALHKSRKAEEAMLSNTRTIQEDVKKIKDKGGRG